MQFFLSIDSLCMLRYRRNRIHIRTPDEKPVRPVYDLCIFIDIGPKPKSGNEELKNSDEHSKFSGKSPLRSASVRFPFGFLFVNARANHRLPHHSSGAQRFASGPVNYASAIHSYLIKLNPLQI